MFIIKSNTTFRIAGCPESGLEAFDFRRKHGIPEQPTHKAELKFDIEDEAIVRAFPEFARHDGDIHIDTGIYQVTGHHYDVPITAGTISAVLSGRCPQMHEGVRALLQEILTANNERDAAKKQHETEVEKERNLFRIWKETGQSDAPPITAYLHVGRGTGEAALSRNATDEYYERLNPRGYFLKNSEGCQILIVPSPGGSLPGSGYDGYAEALKRAVALADPEIQRRMKLHDDRIAARKAQIDAKAAAIGGTLHERHIAGFTTENEIVDIIESEALKAIGYYAESELLGLYENKEEWERPLTDEQFLHYKAFKAAMPEDDREDITLWLAWDGESNAAGKIIACCDFMVGRILVSAAKML